MVHLKIAINGKFLPARITGVERYARNVLEHLVPIAKARGYEIALIGPCIKDPQQQIAFSGLPAGLDLINSKVPTSSVGRHLWEQIVLPRLAYSIKANYLLNLTNTCPIFYPNNVLILHDVSFLKQPKWFSRSFATTYSVLLPYAVRHAKQVITVSEWSRQEIIMGLGALDKLAVILEGVGSEFRSVPESEVKQVLISLGIKAPYILHVGTLQPRKNLVKLIAAYRLICKQLADPPLLVLVGCSSTHFADCDLEKEITGCPSIMPLGYLKDELLPALYSGALYYVSASVYEGFGLTLLEAMACGCPVAASNIMPHREVAGEAAVFFAPESVDNICSALLKVYASKHLREDLQMRGYARVSLFQWEKCAHQLLRTIEQLAGISPA